MFCLGVYLVHRIIRFVKVRRSHFALENFQIIAIPWFLVPYRTRGKGPPGLKQRTFIEFLMERLVTWVAHSELPPIVV